MPRSLARLRTAKRAGWTYDQLADVTGMNRRWLMRLEQGKARPRQATLDQIQLGMDRIDGLLCQHDGCTARATLKFTWPQPIARQESACRAHSETLLGAFIPGLTVEHIKENT